MDIRLTRFKYSAFTKIIAIVLCFLSINTTILFLMLKKEYGIPPDNKEFIETDFFQETASDISQRIISNITNVNPNIRAGFLKGMKKYVNLKYYIVDNGSTVTNITDTSSSEQIRNNFQNAPYSLICDNDYGLMFENGNARYDQDLRSWIRNSAGNKLYLAVTGNIVKGDEFYDASKIYKNRQNIFKDTILKISLAFIIALICFVYIIYASVRYNSSQNSRTKIFNKVYIEIILCVFLLVLILVIPILRNFSYIKNISSVDRLIQTGIALLLTYITGIYLILTIVKRIKNHTLLKNSLLYISFLFIKKVFDSKPVRFKAVALVSIYAAINIFFLFLLLTPRRFTLITPLVLLAVNIYAFIFVGKRSIAFGKIVAGTETIAAGNLDYRLEETGGPEFSRLAYNINNIGQGLKTAVSEAVKSERLKTELITNVSHDLKTPLTSIINYVELLKKEDLPADIKDYVLVLEQKSQKLKSLIDDLFEATKAVSGNIPVNLEKVDPQEIIKQAAAEFDEKIAVSGLDFKYCFPTEKVFIAADGKLLWRVIDNLISNTLKYSLRGSRVYVDVIPNRQSVALIIKNVSSAEMNFNTDEIVERFKRGDSSRHTEGSGLGLAIAKSLTELQGGNFAIEIDGDLFKAVITMPQIIPN